MRIRKKQVRYIPGLKNYGVNKHKANVCNSKHRYIFLNNYSKKKNKLSIVLISVGVILMIMGIVRVFQSTIVYSPIKFGAGSKGGVSFAVSTILLFTGIIVIVFKKINVLGEIFVFLGIFSIVISIFLSLRMSLLPISLFKAILIFGSIFVGVALIVKGILEFMKK